MRVRKEWSVLPDLNSRLSTLVGPDGLEPSPARLRAECAAANTSIPRTMTNDEIPNDERMSNDECPKAKPSLLHFLRHWVFRHSSFPNGAGGIRTPAVRVKSSLCCRYTTTPDEGVAAFESLFALHVDLLRSIARDGVEPSLSPYQNDVLPLHHRAGSG